VAAIYDMEGSKPAPPLPQTLLNGTEYPIYGSSRIGNKTAPNTMFQSAEEYGDYKRMQMQKGYELANHLGNVLATINDRKKGYEIGMANGIAEYYLADVATVSDYYAFGMQNMQRQFEANRYRYGFNGKEKDNETYNIDGGSLDFGSRIYNARIGTWLSLDPEMADFPNESPYVFCGANPVLYLDPDGRKKTKTHVFINLNTGAKVTMSVEVSGELMAKARKTSNFLGISISGSDAQKINTVYDWYDIDVTVVHMYYDGKEVSTTETTSAGKYRTTTEYNWESWADYKVDDPIEKTGWGGVNWTSSTGQGQEDRIGTGEVKSENIDFLLGRLQGLAAGGPSVLGKLDEVIEAYGHSKTTLNIAIGIMAEAFDKTAERIGKVEDIIDGVKELGADMNTAGQCDGGCDSLDHDGKRYGKNDTSGLNIQRVVKIDRETFHGDQ
jgi:RHS repeat-associated protein